VQADRSWKRSNIVHVTEVERGPLGGGRRGCGPGVAYCWAADGFGRCCQRATARVCLLCFMSSIKLFLRRLNAHLSSIVSSKPFQMPVDVISRAATSVDNSSSRLSSFGFSGTIAHGAFSTEMRLTSTRSTSNSLPLYRNRKDIHLSNTAQRLL